MKVFLLIICILVLGTSGLFSEEIKVIYPNGGEEIKMGSQIQIRWASSNKNAKIIIILYKKGIKHSVISEKTENNGRFSWKVPTILKEGKDYRIRIRNANNLSINDFSDRNFSIKK